MTRKKTGDDHRAEALNDYILQNIVGEPELGALSKGKIFLKEEYANFEEQLESNADLLIRREWNKKYEGNIKTLGDLIKVLASLKESITDNSGEITAHKLSSARVVLDIAELSNEQILHALHILGQPTGEELQSLGIVTSDLDILVKQTSLNLARQSSQHSRQQILNLYQASLEIITEKSDQNFFNGFSEVYEYLNHLFRDNGIAFKTYLNKKQVEIFSQKKLKSKVINALHLMLLQAGTSQFRFIEVDDHDRYVRTYFTTRFVKKFTQILIDNYLLNYDFPVYLKNISISYSSLNSILKKPKEVFHQELLNLHHYPKINSGVSHAPIDSVFNILTTQPTLQTTGEFYIRIWNEEDEYHPFSERIYRRLKIDTGDHSRFYFSSNTTGIGGTQSQFIRVINSALFWGINCLKTEYFPIAHDILINKDMIQNNIPSPVWSHSLVKLCRHRTIQEVLEKSCRQFPRFNDSNDGKAELRTYEEFAFMDPVGHGDYCSFDSLLSTARAALQARLKAIKNTGISARTYKHDLLRRMEQQSILDEARSFHNEYPFSTLAMESWLQRELFNKIENSKDKIKDSYVAIDAYLSITEIFLKEGLYRKAYEKLYTLKTWFENASNTWFDWCKSFRENTYEKIDFISDEQTISNSLLARYELCLSEYFYILDWKEEDEEKYSLGMLSKSFKDTEHRDIIELSWKAADRAEQLLTSRLAKYHLINEVSQATFHPHYQLLARIYLLRSKMILLFPKFAGIFNNVLYTLPTEPKISNQRTKAVHIHSARLFLLERARVFSAADGDSELYMMCSFYQCWAWLMAAYEKSDLRLASYENLTINRDTCLSWAKKLRNHALLSYAESGQRYYHEIKEKSGLSKEYFNKYSEYGSYRIDPIPIIQEIDSSVDNQEPGYDSGKSPGILKLDMKYLCLRDVSDLNNDGANTQIIYLFGPKSCYLFFMRALYHLCSDGEEEFACQDKNTVIDWDSKLKHSYRLFNYSWAIAEDHCRTKEEIDGDFNWKISRFEDDKEEYLRDPHIQSVHDLYPHCISEVVDLSKIFSAITLTLRLYTQPELDISIESNINLLFSSLHKITDNHAKISFYKGQKRFNSHLNIFLEKCKSVIKSEINSAEYIKDSVLVKRKRNLLIEKIFSLTKKM